MPQIFAKLCVASSNLITTDDADDVDGPQKKDVVCLAEGVFDRFDIRRLG